MSEVHEKSFQSRLNPPSATKDEEIERLFVELNKTLDGWRKATDESYPELTRLREEILRLRKAREEDEGVDIGQGVLALRFGEFREYFPWEDGKTPDGDFVYAVSLVAAPLPPAPASVKAEGFALVCCGRGGKDGVWGYFHVEKDSKQAIAADLHDKLEAKAGEWFWLRLSTKPSFRNK